MNDEVAQKDATFDVVYTFALT